MKAKSALFTEISKSLFMGSGREPINFRMDRRGNIIIQPDPSPTNVRSPAQMAQRQKYRACLDRWNAMPLAQKLKWTNDRTLTNLNNFLSHCLKIPIPVYAFGHHIYSAVAAGTSPAAIGGKRGIVWYVDRTPNLIAQLNSWDLSVIKIQPSPTPFPTGIGGDMQVIWYCDRGIDQIMELSPIDFSIIRTAPTPNARSMDTGGGIAVLYNCDTTYDRIFELAVTDFSIIRFATSPHLHPSGIGGTKDTIWHCDRFVDNYYKLSPIDFSVIKRAPTIGQTTSGAGGDATNFYASDLGTNRVYKIGTG